ncbi:MAG TPA: hypothetical protein VJA17_03750, partial [Candidatus Omnitrophota bacterium]|nr:hypothetical protein [Candidatus Omnitrophota bacterium]
MMSAVSRKQEHAQEEIFTDHRLWLVLAMCWVYWLYLLFFSNMIIVYDAGVFEDAGKMIYENGWIGFFKSGPRREPLYPFLVSLSMHAGEWLGISYHYLQKFIQIIFLFSTQLLLFKLLQELKANRTLSLVIILYFGFSPAIVNSAMSLYSEIASYPFVLLIVWLGYRSLRAVHGGSWSR